MCASTGQATALWFRSFNAAATEVHTRCTARQRLSIPLGSRPLLMWLLMCDLAGTGPTSPEREGCQPGKMKTDRAAAAMEPRATTANRTMPARARC